MRMRRFLSFAVSPLFFILWNERRVKSLTAATRLGATSSFGGFIYFSGRSESVKRKAALPGDGRPKKSAFRSALRRPAPAFFFFAARVEVSFSPNVVFRVDLQLKKEKTTQNERTISSEAKYFSFGELLKRVT